MENKIEKWKRENEIQKWKVQLGTGNRELEDDFAVDFLTTFESLALASLQIFKWVLQVGERTKHSFRALDTQSIKTNELAYLQPKFRT